MGLLFSIHILRAVITPQNSLSDFKIFGTPVTAGIRVFDTKLHLFGTVSGRFDPDKIEVNFENGKIDFINPVNLVNSLKCSICFGYLEKREVIVLPCPTIRHIYCKSCVERSYHAALC